MSIKDNILNLIQNLPPQCKLVAVSKTQPVERILEAYHAGQRIFGENKVQELAQKFDALPKDIEWHMIGHLQTNKVKYIAQFVSLIHSVDSLKLLTEINKQALKAGRIISCLLQIHIGSEETKFGFTADEVIHLITTGHIELLTNIQIVGLMGMATFTDDEKKIREEFKTLKEIFDQLKSRTLPHNVNMRELSMGMSNDYKIALQEGSTIIRVGSGIFGERIYH
ncbi:MAG TPA: YggS family pyridoxal phosphate-dependent enzyme [Cyclobacteriaceae bacterium]|nr:YggS family pyridoxal phosphate-dependent enzyme [Cyclobacteriaceae bacterium]